MPKPAPLLDMSARCGLIALLLLGGAPAAAQEVVDPDAYADESARELVALARDRHARVDSRITGYEVTARERMSAYMDVAGFERLLARRETASRIEWSRDTVRIEVLAAREAQPMVSGSPQLPPAGFLGSLPALAFDPIGSEMLLRLDSTVMVHPLSAGSEAHYRFSRGDSLSIRLPDGREVHLRELRIAARRADPTLINGSFWIDAATHAVVRAVFRLSRARSASGSQVTVGVPEVTIELDHVAIEYGLWELQWWLPRAVVARGVINVGGLRFPLSYDRQYADFRVDGDTLPASPTADVAGIGPAERPCRPRLTGVFSIGSPPGDSAWNAYFDERAARIAADSAGVRRGEGCDRTFVVTRDEDVDLVTSPALDGSVYDGDGPVREEDLRELTRLLGAIPDRPWDPGPPRVQLLTPELVRYNRVEGLSVGAGAVLPLGPAELDAEIRVGTTGEVGARLAGVRSGPGWRTELAGYRRIEAVDVGSQPFSLSGSASALLLGRDENDYFRGTGVELLLSPPPARARSWDIRLFAEAQEPVAAGTDFSLRDWLDGGFEPRDNLSADRLDQWGVTIRLRQAWGDDPARLRTRAELELHGETGDRTLARPLARLEADRRLGSRLGAGFGLTAGTALGDVSAQRMWQVGGAATVRGHSPASLRGEGLWLARSELTWGTQALRLALFADAGWAGAWDEATAARPLRGAGVGASLLDNLLRVDLARGIGGGGWALYARLGGGL